MAKNKEAAEQVEQVKAVEQVEAVAEQVEAATAPKEEAVEEKTADKTEKGKGKGKGKDTAPKARTFFKREFVKSERFAKHKDLVNALLEDGKKYSIKEVEDIIHNFLYGKKK